jgi:hypothetical protein
MCSPEWHGATMSPARGAARARLYESLAPQGQEGLGAPPGAKGVA